MPVVTLDYEYKDRYEEIEELLRSDVSCEPEEILFALIESKSFLDEHLITLPEYEDESLYVTSLIKKIKSKMRDVRHVIKYEETKDEHENDFD